IPTRSRPTLPWCAGCWPGSSRAGPGCRSTRSSRTGPTTTSTGSATTWPSGCRASAGPPPRRTPRRSGCPRLAPQLPLALPVQLARGRPAEGYPFGWSVYEWLPGENANGTIGDLEQAAVDLAGFVRALRRVDTTGAHSRHPHGRGGPLAQHDEHVRRSVAELGDRVA